MAQESERGEQMKVKVSLDVAGVFATGCGQSNCVFAGWPGLALTEPLDGWLTVCLADSGLDA